jgi:pyruvate dehydrogenase E2 component (dihydrolipoamide acetyltransferase)
MPRLSDSMEEGAIVQWLKGDGDPVRRGDELVEIETDKATMAYEAEADGVLQIIAAQGATLPVGAPIARLHESVTELAGVQTDELAAARGAGGPSASPVARRLAGRLGVDLSVVAGSGPSGRIVKADVANHAKALGGPARAAGDEAATGAEPERLSRIQETVAHRMSESSASVPDFSITMDVDADALVRLRGELAATAGIAPPRLPTYTDFVVRACAIGLREHPYVNGSYRDDQFERHLRVNIGIAVTAGDSLLVPVVADADQLSLSAIASENRRLSDRVRNGSVTPAELAGGTFTVSNLGMFGVDSFTAIINPPQAAILAVGAVNEAAVARGGQLHAGWRMNLTLSCDHRIVTGAAAAAFLARVRDLLAQPLALMLEAPAGP